MFYNSGLCNPRSLSYFCQMQKICKIGFFHFGPVKTVGTIDGSGAPGDGHPTQTGLPTRGIHPGMDHPAPKIEYIDRRDDGGTMVLIRFLRKDFGHPWVLEVLNKFHVYGHVFAGDHAHVQTERGNATDYIWFCQKYLHANGRVTIWEKRDLVVLETWSDLGSRENPSTCLEFTMMLAPPLGQERGELRTHVEQTFSYYADKRRKYLEAWPDGEDQQSNQGEGSGA
jgi:hypothetical protein